MSAARHVFITGGTSGIGAAIARAFIATGANVTATGATAAEVQAAQAHGPNAGIAFETLDVRDGDAVKARLGQYAGLDVLVNCAGIIQRQVELEPEAFARTVDINLNGTMRTCAAAREALKARSGCIVNTASMLSFFGGGLVPGYSASKGGVAQLTKSLAIAYAPDHIRVNAVAPGWIHDFTPQRFHHRWHQRHWRRHCPRLCGHWRLCHGYGGHPGRGASRTGPCRPCGH